MQRHAKYLSRCIQVMPSSAASFDSSRLTIEFFGVSGLDLLGRLDDKLAPEVREKHKAWIKSLYVYSEKRNSAGFHGGNYLRVEGGGHLRSDEHAGHIAMTYTALSTYLILGGDIATDFDLDAIANGIAELQRRDGSFYSSNEGGENDMRFVFCAAAVSRLTGKCRFDVDSAVDYILRSVSYEGGIGQGPGLEAHGGSTYCAVAALKLMDKLDVALSRRQRKRLERWCVNRLNVGFNGRPNKPDDTCYTFWIGAALDILRPFPDVPRFVMKSSGFVGRTQDDVVGGLSKWEDNSPDPLHTYLGFSGLSIAGSKGIGRVDSAVNISQRAIDSLTS